MTFPQPFYSPVLKPTYSYEGNTTITTDTTTYTFSSHAIGTPSSRRIIGIIAHGMDGSAVISGNVWITSATVGGVAATVSRNDVTSNRIANAILYAEVPTGTTADIVLNVQALDRCSIAVYAIHNLAVRAPRSSNIGSFGDPSTDTVNNVLDGGILLTGSCLNSTTAFATSGFTERYDVDIESAFRVAGGEIQTTGLSNVPLSFDSSANNRLVWAWWR